MIAQKITGLEVKNCEIHAQVQYNDFDTIDTIRDLVDLGGVQPQLSDKDGELQDQQNQFQDELLLQDQGVCINTEKLK